MTKPLAMTVGRRKTSVVRVRLREGTGKMTLNGKSIEEYFPTMASRLRVLEPFRVAGVEGKFDIEAKLEGGGTTGQVDGIRLAIARALIENDLSLRPVLKKAGLLTRDSRIKERKKAGLKKARKAPQYSKR